MKRRILCAVVILTIGIIACNNQNKSDSETPQADSIVQQTTSDMKSFISIFEIPATEISRAVSFYQAILDINIEKFDIPEMQMGIFPYEGQMVTGVIIQGEGYQPSADGITLYLNGGDNLQIILDKVAKNGGEIIAPKTPHGDGVGYFALFLDTEGNKIGLHSPN
jgi:predicted enzyme related to lactoylglutathione lyase